MHYNSAPPQSLAEDCGELSSQSLLGDCNGAEKLWVIVCDDPHKKDCKSKSKPMYESIEAMNWADEHGWHEYQKEYDVYEKWACPECAKNLYY